MNVVSLKILNELVKASILAQGQSRLDPAQQLRDHLARCAQCGADNDNRQRGGPIPSCPTAVYLEAQSFKARAA